MRETAAANDNWNEGVRALPRGMAIVFLVLLYSAPIALVGLQAMRSDRRRVPAAADHAVPFGLPGRLPRGYGLGRVWRRYVGAVLDVRLRRPEQARELAESVRTTGRLPQSVEGLVQVESALARTLQEAERPELAEALRWRAWLTAIRLWVARGYPW